jgi:hypothetical protein
MLCLTVQKVTKGNKQNMWKNKYIVLAQPW